MSDTYRENVFKLMQMGSGQIVLNDQPQHAAVLFECFFKHAKHSVKIFCRNLDPRVFDTDAVLNAASDALIRGVVIDILVQEEPDENSRFANWITHLDNEAAKRVCFHTNTSAESDMIAGLSENFAIMDGKAIRFEPNSDNVKARASMNQPKVADALGKLFFELKESIGVPVS